VTPEQADFIQERWLARWLTRVLPSLGRRRADRGRRVEPTPRWWCEREPRRVPILQGKCYRGPKAQAS
jgi:hypothetical protein